MINNSKTACRYALGWLRYRGAIMALLPTLQYTLGLPVIQHTTLSSMHIVRQGHCVCAVASNEKMDFTFLAKLSLSGHRRQKNCGMVWSYDFLVDLWRQVITAGLKFVLQFVSFSQTWWQFVLPSLFFTRTVTVYRVCVCVFLADTAIDWQDSASRVAEANRAVDQILRLLPKDAQISCQGIV